MNIPDLRSPREKVCGIVFFGRMLDKARLHAAAKLPEEYVGHLGMGFDERCVRFLHIEYSDFAERVQAGGTDGEILGWCFERGRKPTDEEVMVWNDFMCKRGWNDETTERFQSRLPDHLKGRIVTYFDAIDADEERL